MEPDRELPLRQLQRRFGSAGRRHQALLRLAVLRRRRYRHRTGRQQDHPARPGRRRVQVLSDAPPHAILFTRRRASAKTCGDQARQSRERRRRLCDERLMELFFWLATQPLWVAAAIMIGGCLLMSVAGTLIVNSIYLPPELIQINLLGGFKFAFLSSVYAGYLGLLLYGVYQQYEQTRGFIDLEVTQLTQLD